MEVSSLNYSRGLTSMVYKFFDKKTGAEVNVNEEQTPELHKSKI